VSSVLEFELRRISTAEYHRMIEAGVFDGDERLELLEGVIVPLSPQSPERADLIQWLNNTLARLIGPQYEVRPQLPLTAGESSEPAPDLAIVPAGRARTRHPTTALLVIEIARESLRKDRLLKAGIYARAGVPEYWIVNTAERCVEFHRDPDPTAARYATMLTVRPGQELKSASVPGVRLPVGDFFEE
jgi:Uma2 family endonuclease